MLGEFRAGLSTLLDPDALAACVVSGRRELPPAEGVDYRAFADPSGGRRDAFTPAVGDGERAVADVVQAWTPPLNPSGVVAEVVRGYRVSRVTGDRYSGEWPREGCRGRGVEYEVASLERSQLYVGLLPAINARFGAS